MFLETESQLYALEQPRKPISYLNIIEILKKVNIYKQEIDSDDKKILENFLNYIKIVKIGKEIVKNLFSEGRLTIDSESVIAYENFYKCYKFLDSNSSEFDFFVNKLEIIINNTLSETISNDDDINEVITFLRYLFKISEF